jgi:hypothetical protein
MRNSFAVFTFAVLALVQSATAITFPSLTTIYVGTGVRDNGGGDNSGLATAFHCSNVSGTNVQIRFLVLRDDGSGAGAITRPVPHGGSITVSTHLTAFFIEDDVVSPSIVIGRGVINIESTESAVFCQAYITEAATTVPDSAIPLKLIRVNPHPGTVE